MQSGGLGWLARDSGGRGTGLLRGRQSAGLVPWLGICLPASLLCGWVWVAGGNQERMEHKKKEGEKGGGPFTHSQARTEPELSLLLVLLLIRARVSGNPDILHQSSPVLTVTFSPWALFTLF